jgi:predicted N-acetyltransferase YhbS
MAAMDMLVKLYAPDSLRLAGLGAAPVGVLIRRALAAEAEPILSWVTTMFGLGWRAEAAAALSRTPARCLVAVADGTVAGFACWDVAALGFFGPLGVDPSMRRRGLGTALLGRGLLAMQADGYGYAVIGGVADASFYASTVGAVAIEGSSPGLYAGLLRSR